jgi:exonuclease SbcC
VTVLHEAEPALAALPERARLQRALLAHEQLEALAKQRATSEKQLAKADAASQKTVATVADAENILEEATHSLEHARIGSAAADIARTLVAGDACPVCRQKVKTAPDVELPEDLERAKTLFDAASKRKREADDKASKAAQDVAVIRASIAELDNRDAALRKEIADLADPALVRAQVAEIEAAEKRCSVARAAAAEARGKAAEARKVLDAIAAETAAARKRLGAARDAVAELGPPTLEHDDIAADWRALAAWAAELLPQKRNEASTTRERAAAAEAEGRSIVESQRRACAEAGLDDVQSPRDETIKALERAKDAAERIEVAVEAAKELRRQIAELDERATVARALGGHLKANAFERWVLRQALTTLVDGATSMLLELSNGQYSLTLDKNFNFSVIDHRNANTERSARTLSGGETFLASLALALALSDRIAQLSANSAVRLESIFLDEGFGSLDEETLETVATAIEQLAAMNRVVGIVTHVRALAERVPVRFEVRKGPVTSEIEKVFA